MTAPDFKTQVTEVVSFGETTGFILKDITGAYNAVTNTGGWDPDAGAGPNLSPSEILKAMIIVTPYKGSDIPIVLEMTDDTDPLYWKDALTHLDPVGEGITLDDTISGLETFPNGYWKFKSFYWPGYYTAAFAVAVVGTFSLGEIVQGRTSGATGYLVKGGATPLHVTLIQGTFTNGEIIDGLTSSAYVTVTTFTLVGELLTGEIYSYLNNQSILTATRNTIRKQPLDIVLPRINEKHALYVAMADLLLETLDDAVEVGQVDNYVTIFDYLNELIGRIDETYCIDS